MNDRGPGSDLRGLRAGPCLPVFLLVPDLRQPLHVVVGALQRTLHQPAEFLPAAAKNCQRL